MVTLNVEHLTTRVEVRSTVEHVHRAARVIDQVVSLLVTINVTGSVRLVQAVDVCVRLDTSDLRRREPVQILAHRQPTFRSLLI